MTQHSRDRLLLLNTSLATIMPKLSSALPVIASLGMNFTQLRRHDDVDLDDLEAAQRKLREAIKVVNSAVGDLSQTEDAVAIVKFDEISTRLYAAGISSPHHPHGLIQTFESLGAFSVLRDIHDIVEDAMKDADVLKRLELGSQADIATAFSIGQSHKANWLNLCELNAFIADAARTAENLPTLDDLQQGLTVDFDAATA